LCCFWYGAIATAPDMIQLGNPNVTDVNTQWLYTYSDGRFKFNVQENVKGLEFINKLRPVYLSDEHPAIRCFH